jgi:hypothetical protein
MGEAKKINIGDFATCQKGELGLILWEHQCRDKRSNKPYVLYHGINLSREKFGLNWQSKNPTKVSKNHVKKLFKPNLTNGRAERPPRRSSI